MKFETILKYHEWYLCQISLQIMLLIVYTTTRKWFVIFTCRYFKLSSNTTALSQSNCRNFSCNSINRKIFANFTGGRQRDMLRSLSYAFARQYLMCIYYSKTLRLLKQFAIPFCGQKRTCQSNFLNGIVIFFNFLVRFSEN